ncbi:SF1B family DNA helicase RecD2 [Psychrobacillus sp. FSL H8-0510]|uniref:SF1B family DNA helicase RecD2 n=1 Tax=Psychrobacillus sp. FSL H8-0510 TaxID=2921394 RepID=UPI0030FC1C6C
MATFTIKRIMKRDPLSLFTVASIEFIEQPDGSAPTKDHKVVGEFMSIFEGDDFSADGEWVDSGKYGHRFQVKQPKKLMPQTNKGMKKFLKKHVQGLGVTIASRIVDQFGINCMEVIEKQPEKLLEIQGMTKAKAEQIHTDMVKHKNFEEVALYMLSVRGNLEIANHLYTKFGDEAVRKVRSNPYILVGSCDVDFHKADAIADAMGIDTQNANRIRAGILSMLESYAKRRGDLFLHSRELEHSLAKWINSTSFRHKLSETESLRLAKVGVEFLLNTGEILRDFDEEENECIYLKIYHRMESGIVSRMKHLVSQERGWLVSPQDVTAWVEKQTKKTGVGFAEGQKNAVVMALTKGVSVLTGGPGTGKTHTVRAVIDCLKQYRPSAVVHLLAPTGKASKRMEEMAKRPASTIHRALKYGSEQEGNVLIEGDLVVVDETSMMDVFICHSLLTAIDEGVSILFVGDVDQLPSVGPGLVLKDFIESGRIPTTELTEVFRQALDSQIITNAYAMKRGLTTEDVGGISWNNEKGDFFFIETDNNHKKIQDFLIKSIQKLLKQGKRLDDIQVLTPMKRGELGVWYLNQTLQKVFNPDGKGVENPFDKGSYFREGDKVIHMANNTDLDVMNGEVGKILEIIRHRDHGTLVAVEYDDEKVVEYTLEDLEELELAYAMTVHKSQGSEYPVVIMPFHEMGENMLNRNLVYTGWTRAKELIINIGSVEIMNKAALKVEQTNRNSLIGRKLRLAINNFDRFSKSS